MCLRLDVACVPRCRDCIRPAKVCEGRALGCSYVIPKADVGTGQGGRRVASVMCVCSSIAVSSDWRAEDGIGSCKSAHQRALGFVLSRAQTVSGELRRERAVCVVWSA